MVYRGKPSAGCENCRKAKKRCGLERPACNRCVKSNKICSGYRDTTALQIQDETRTVKQKAQKQQAKAHWTTPSAASSSSLGGLLTPENSVSARSTPSLELEEVEIVSDNVSDPLLAPTDTMFGAVDFSVASLIIPTTLKPKKDDIATSYFFHQFTSNTHWQFLRAFQSAEVDPCLDLAIKACGMAALDNVQNVVMGREFARSMYAEALGLLNTQLRDPKLCKTDASLIAVSMLGYYENLTCEGRPSIQSWKAHIKGATQLLKIRGTKQFNSRVGRILFRELRAQIMIQCIWDDTRPPDFFWDFQPELDAKMDDQTMSRPIDHLTSICLDYAVLRADIRTGSISDVEAAEVATEVERQFIQWSIDSVKMDDKWRYDTIDVADSDHVWNGKVHSYVGHPMPAAWNTWRCMRIMLSRTQEWLCDRFQFSKSEREEQLQYFRRIRRQMTDDICATVPVQLGHAHPAYSSPCVLITAYGSVWPLFFAGTCSLERVAKGAIQMANGKPCLSPSGSAAATQALWIMGRLEHIAQHIGLKWADAIAATLRGEFHVYENHLENTNDSDVAKENVKLSLPWVREIETAADPARYLIESPVDTREPLDTRPQPEPLLSFDSDDVVGDILPERARHNREINGPIWLGREQRRYEQAASDCPP